MLLTGEKPISKVETDRLTKGCDMLHADVLMVCDSLLTPCFLTKIDCLYSKVKTRVFCCFCFLFHKARRNHIDEITAFIVYYGSDFSSSTKIDALLC